MDRYISRGNLISGAPLERSMEVSIASGARAVRIRDLKAPYSSVSSHYLTATGGTLDTLVFPIFWEAGQVVSVISLSLDRDDGTTSTVQVQCVDPSSTAVVSALNAHELLSAVNEQGYLRVSAVEGDVWRIRVNEYTATAGQASASDLINGVFDHVFVDAPGSTPDPRSYGLRGAVRSTPSRVDTPTTSVSSYIQRHEDRTSAGINRAVDSVAANIESIRDHLGAVRVRHQLFQIPNDVFFGAFGEHPVRWHKEGESVTALVVDGSMLPVLLPHSNLQPQQIYQLTGPDGHALARGDKAVDLQDIHGSPSSVYGRHVHCVDAIRTYTPLIEDAGLGELSSVPEVRLSDASWQLEDEVTLNIEGVVIGKVVRGDEVHIQKGGMTSTFLVDTVPRNGRVTVRAALTSRQPEAKVGLQLIPPELVGGSLTITAGPLPTVTELVYIKLDTPIRVVDLEDVGPLHVSLPIAAPASDLTPADKPTDTVLGLPEEVTEYLLRAQGPLYRELTNHIELNLQGLYGRQGLGKSIFGARGNLLTDIDYASRVPSTEDVNKVLSSVSTANYGAPITFSKNKAYRYASIQPFSAAGGHYADVFNERRLGIELDSCVFDPNAGTIALQGADKGKLDLSDQGRVVRITSRVGGTSDLSGAKLFVIVEVLNTSRAKVQPVIGAHSITPTLYPDIGDTIPCVLRFVSPTVADELTEYASLLRTAPSLTVASSTVGSSRLRLPAVAAGYGGKDQINVLGSGATGGGEITLEPITNQSLNFSHLSVAVKFDGTEPVFLIGGVEYLSQSTGGLKTLNDGLFESLVAPILINGVDIDSPIFANRRPATTFNAELLKKLPRVAVPTQSEVIQELADLGAYDLVVKANRDESTSVESKVVFTFEAGEHVKVGTSILPIPNSEQIKSIFTGMYMLKSVNVLPNGAVELRAKPRLRVQKEADYLGNQLSGGSSAGNGVYLLGTVSFYKVLEETKEVRGGYPVRSMYAQENRAGLAVTSLPESVAGIETTVGQLSTGLQVQIPSIGTGMHVTNGDAAAAKEAGLSSNPALGIDMFRTPAVDITRSLSSPFVYAGLVTNVFAFAAEFQHILGELTGPTGKMSYPDESLQATEVLGPKIKGLAAALRAVNILPSTSDYGLLGQTALLFADTQTGRFTYREPVVLVGTREGDNADPLMHGTLSVFNEVGTQAERRAATSWDTLDAALQVKGDLYIEAGDLVVVPTIANEAFRGDLKYYAYNTPHVGYTGYADVSGVRSHLVPVSDAGVLPSVDVPFASDFLHDSNQRFGARKVFELDHSGLGQAAESINADNDLRRKHAEATYAQASGRYSGAYYQNLSVAGRNTTGFFTSGRGLHVEDDLLQPTSARILGEPRKVSKWFNAEPIGFYARVNGSEFSAVLPLEDTERYAVPSDVGRACRITVSVRNMDTFLDRPIPITSKSSATTELAYLSELLTARTYLTDSTGSPALVEFDGYTLVIVFTGIVLGVDSTAVRVQGPNLPSLLNLPLGGDTALWDRIAAVTTLTVKAELFGKRWDLNASAIATDSISVTDTGAVARGWLKGDIEAWRDLNGDLLDYIADDEIIRITATASGSFFRNDVYFLGDLIATGEATINQLNVSQLRGRTPVQVQTGHLTDGNGIVQAILYPSAEKPTTLEALQHMWEGARESRYGTGVNASQDNSNLQPISALPSGDLIEGGQSGGVTLDDTFNVGGIKTAAVRYVPSSASPTVTIQERHAGMEGSLITLGVPRYKSGVGSVSSYVEFDLSDQDTEMHVCAYADPRLTVTEGAQTLSTHTFNVFTENPNSDNPYFIQTEKEIVVWVSVGSDLRDGVAYLHRIYLSNGTPLPISTLNSQSGTVYRYKYLFGLTIRDAASKIVEDGYLMQGNPVPHQFGVPHIRPEGIDRLFQVGTEQRGDPHIEALNDTWGDAINGTSSSASGAHDEEKPTNILPSPAQLNQVGSTGVGAGSHAFFNDIVLNIAAPSGAAKTSFDALPKFSDYLFGSKWGLLYDAHKNALTYIYDASIDANIAQQGLFGGHVGIVGEYQMPRNFAMEGFPYGQQTESRYVNTIASYGPALRDAFSSIAELTPTRYVVRLPKPTSEWVGREFKVAVPSYSTHSGVNPFLGAWSESRKVGSLTDYFFYIYTGFWTGAELGVLDVIKSMPEAKDIYAGHLIPVISESGLVGNHSDTLWPSNDYDYAELVRGGNHKVYADWGSSYWQLAVVGSTSLQLNSNTYLQPVNAGLSTSQMYFKTFGSPTYGIDALKADDPNGIPKPNYPGFEDIDVNSTEETPAYSRAAEECDILVVCDAGYLPDNNQGIERKTSLVDTVKVAPTQNTRLSYTCVPLEVGITDTTLLAEQARGKAYKWVRI